MERSDHPWRFCDVVHQHIEASETELLGWDNVEELFDIVVEGRITMLKFRLQVLK